MHESVFKNQVIPLSLTVLVCAVLIAVLYFEIVLINNFGVSSMATQIRWYDVLIGLTIYLKTSIDFALFIGNLMHTNAGWKSRVAIELGTAAGNALGTLAILALWAFFKEVSWLLAIMIFLASLVLFRLAEDSLEHALVKNFSYSTWFKQALNILSRSLKKINSLINPVLKYVMPNWHLGASGKMGFWRLFGFAFTIPFLLGLDDFAGYVPLFSVVNVFGFAVGVFVGHMLLNMFLYISPARTIRVVKNPYIAFFGSLAFVGLGLWGLVEVVRIFTH